MARAAAKVIMSRETLQRIQSGGTKKGDVLAVAEIAAIQAAKRTWDLIPMCHPIALTGVDIAFTVGDDAPILPPSITIEATVRCKGVTGVEMEALTAVSVAALTIYDMCKAVQKDMRIEGIHLIEKTGGHRDVGDAVLDALPAPKQEIPDVGDAALGVPPPATQEAPDVGDDAHIVPPSTEQETPDDV